MERMKRLQEEREDEEASQEEMTTRFEKEKKESLFVVSGDTFHSFPHSGAFSISLSLPFLFAFDFLVAQTIKNLPAMQKTQFHPWVGKVPIVLRTLTDHLRPPSVFSIWIME